MAPCLLLEFSGVVSFPDAQVPVHPSAIAMYLVYVLSVGMMGSLESHEAEHAREMRALTRLIQQLCVNTADNSEDRAGCFPELTERR